MSVRLFLFWKYVYLCHFFKIPQVCGIMWSLSLSDSTWCDHFQVRPCCCEWHYFILFYGLHFAVYVDHVIFIHSPVDGHWGRFHDLAIANSGAVNIGLYVCFWISVLSGCLPRSGAAGPYADLRPSILFTVAAPTYTPTHSAGGFPFSTSPPAFITSRIFDEGHFDWFEVIPHCDFDLHFSNN